jgi:hypothetical protein
MIVLNVCAPNNPLPDFLSGATEQISRFNEGLLLRLLQPRCRSQQQEHFIICAGSRLVTTQIRQGASYKVCPLSDLKQKQKL